MAQVNVFQKFLSKSHVVLMAEIWIKLKIVCISRINFVYLFHSGLFKLRKWQKEIKWKQKDLSSLPSYYKSMSFPPIWREEKIKYFCKINKYQSWIFCGSIEANERNKLSSFINMHMLHLGLYFLVGTLQFLCLNDPKSFVIVRAFPR